MALQGISKTLAILSSSEMNEEKLQLELSSKVELHYRFI